MPFTPKFVDLVRNFTTVQGTGPVVLGAAVSGYTSIAQALSAGEQFYYCIQSVDKPQEREVGRGTMASDGKIAREAVQGSLTQFSGGTKTIALVAAAEWFSKLELGEIAGGASIEASSRAGLAALPATAGMARYLTEARREGLFKFDSTNLAALVAADTAQGIYIAPASDPTGGSGAWVRQFIGPADVKWWGAIPDDLGYLGTAAATDNADAIDGALTTLKARSISVNPTDRFCEPLYFDGHYYTSRTINLKQGMRLLGNSTKYVIRSRLRFPVDLDGIIVNTTTSTGNTTEAATTDAVGAMIDGIHLLGGGGSSGHGFRLRARASIRNGGARNFGQDGVNIRTYFGGPTSTLGNANNFDLNDLWLFANGRHGVLAAGSDSNAGYGNGLDCSYNGGFGIADYTFLGSNWSNLHTDQNGNRNWVTNAGVPSGTEVFNGTDLGKARCFHLGRAYTCKIGMEATSSTTEPTPGMTTPWIDSGVYAAANASIPQWTNGMQVKAGGAYASGYMETDGVVSTNANNRCVFAGAYAESGQAASQMWSVGHISGFIDAGGYFGSGTWERTGNGRRVFSSGLETDTGSWVLGGEGGIDLVGTGAFAGDGRGQMYRSASSGLVFIGAAGAVSDLTWFNKNGTQVASVPTGTINLVLAGNLNVAGDITGTFGVITLANNAGAFAAGTIDKTASHGVRIFAATGSQYDFSLWKPDGSNILNVPTGTLDLDLAGNVNVAAGKAYRANGAQVVGARKTGWSTDTGTAKRTANATYAGTAEAAYTQATIQALMNAVQDLSQTVKALKDDLHAAAGHGLIGA